MSTSHEQRRQHFRGWAVAALVSWLGFVSCVGEELPPGEEDSESRSAWGSPGADSHYGNTPDELMPYRGFQEPAKKFFDEPLIWRGAGREIPIPGLEGLQSVKIGMLIPLSGGSAEARIGEGILRGARLAIEEINAAGGYRGVPYELVVRDDTGAWKGATHEMVQLACQEGVWAILGSVDAASTHVMLRLSLKLQVPLVNTVSGDPTITEHAIPWLVRVCADDRQASYALARHMFKEKGHQRAALVRENSRYGRVGVREFVDAARRLGHPIRVEVRYLPGRQEEMYDVQLAHVQASEADSVVIWGDARDAARILHEMRKRGMDLPVYGCDRLAEAEFLELAGGEGEGVVVAATWNPRDGRPRTARFFQAYEDRFGGRPGSVEAHAYDGIRLLVQAMERRGLNRTLIRDELVSIRSLEGVTGTIRLSETGNDLGRVWLARVQSRVFEYFQ